MRLMLEKMSHADACFVTLTYRDEEIQHIVEWKGVGPVVGNLVPGDAQGWLKRLRSMVSPRRLRFFLVGEYGEINGRPHYHAAVFGLPQCFNGRTNHRLKSCCSVCKMVQASWGKGRIDVGELNEASSSYIAGYVTKKWTKEDSWTSEKLKGRRPEFVRMSLKPGIGADAVRMLFSFGVLGQKAKFVNECIDVPAVLRKNSSLLPLGRYLRSRAREALRRSVDAPQSELGRYCAEMQRLYREDSEAARAQGISSCFIDPKAAFVRRTRQKIKSLEARSKIYSNERQL